MSPSRLGRATVWWRAFSEAITLHARFNYAIYIYQRERDGTEGEELSNAKSPTVGHKSAQRGWVKCRNDVYGVETTSVYSHIVQHRPQSLYDCLASPSSSVILLIPSSRAASTCALFRRLSIWTSGVMCSLTWTTSHEAKDDERVSRWSTRPGV